MRTLKLSTFIIVIILIAISCTPDSPAPVNTAGKGGNANITFDLKHHGVAHNLIKCKVFVKYNTQDAPANGIYDDSSTTTDPDTMQIALFSGLKNGNYYFYGTGCDTSLFKHVLGGIPFVISSQANQTVNLPVSENTVPCN